MQEIPENITLKFKTSIQDKLGVYPTVEQNELLVHLAEFVMSDKLKGFILKGYAGTGKSTVVSALVKALKDINVNSVLLAPTGRAAKVIASYSKMPAYTIHKKIYYKKVNASGYASYVIAPNVHSRTLFVVDEASMISDQSVGGVFGNDGLLRDLLKYVRSGSSCKLLLVGDTAQLPPVGFDDSPALDPLLLDRMGLVNRFFELTHVVRQEHDSGILHNATLVRSQIGVEEIVIPHLQTYPDFQRITGYELQEALEDNFDAGNVRDTVVITRSNKRAIQFNQEIRSRIFWHESELVEGDVLMVVKNNYFWSGLEEIGFIANGDLIEVIRINKYIDRYGFRFADVTVAFTDYKGSPEMDVLLMLNALTEPHPSMPRDQLKVLWNNVLLDYTSEKNLGRRRKKAMNNPYMNALIVKYGYAITCHKSQGGQWPKVFVDHGYLTEDMMGISFMRWLYTAITRATEKVALINFHSSFFPEEF